MCYIRVRTRVPICIHIFSFNRVRITLGFYSFTITGFHSAYYIRTILCYTIFPQYQPHCNNMQNGLRQWRTVLKPYN